MRCHRLRTYVSLIRRALGRLVRRELLGFIFAAEAPLGILGVAVLPIGDDRLEPLDGSSAAVDQSLRCCRDIPFILAGFRWVLDPRGGSSPVRIL